ncbi:putative U3 small nucleolar RNA-associated protein 7 [Coemansia sp. RSA 2607]|nr:putative U3 small nucleolar RNA-associated protein 7 [Coemansia sp. RSA 2607]
MFAAAKLGAVEATTRRVQHTASDGEGSASDSEKAPRTLRDQPAKSDQPTRPSGGKKRKSDKDEKQTAEEPKKDKEPDEIQQRTALAAKKYQRGGPTSKTTKVRSKRAQASLDHAKRRREEAAEEAARSEMLLTQDAGFLEAEGLERTYKFTQAQLAENLDLASAGKIFDLKLADFGPYSLRYSDNGRHLLLGGKRGHLASIDWRSGRLGCELHVRETVRDVTWLHNQSLFAAAQKKYVYIYDHTGAEVHCLQKHVEPTALGFLPFHFLLASTGMTGQVVFQDVTEGAVVGSHRPGLGPSHVLKVNPYNAVVHVGHGNGTVSLWSPKQGKPLARMLCHRGPIQAMAIDRSGTYMATSGLDGRVKVWDIRNFKPLHDYKTKQPAQALDISQRGLLAAGWGPHVSVWKDALSTQVDKPYMTQLLPGVSTSALQFVPYDDVLGVGHSQGLSSLVIPGSGEPNFDAYVANPYQTTKQRQESEVKSLLDKLAPDTIALDPTFIARLDPRSQAQKLRESVVAERERYAQDKEEGKYLDSSVRNKTKGRNSTAKRYLRKTQANVTDLKRLQAMERVEQEEKKRQQASDLPAEHKGALSMFYKDQR